MSENFTEIGLRLINEHLTRIAEIEATMVELGNELAKHKKDIKDLEDAFEIAPVKVDPKTTSTYDDDWEGSWESSYCE